MEKYLLDKSRTIPLIGMVEECMAESLSYQLSYLAMVDKPIIVYLNSYGGETLHGMAMLDMIHSCPCEVWVVATGYCWSMAAMVLGLAPDGYRAATPGTSVLLHAGRIPGGGEAGAELFKNIRSMNDHLESMDRDLNKDFCKRTKYTFKKFQKDMDNANEFWLTTTQAAKKGLIDRVWDYDLWKEVNAEIRKGRK